MDKTVRGKTLSSPGPMDSEREAPEAGGLQGPGSSSAGEPSLVGRRLGIVIRRAEGRGFEARPGLQISSIFNGFPAFQAEKARSRAARFLRGLHFPLELISITLRL